MQKTLRFFSYIFHPLFISVYAALLYFIFGRDYLNYAEIYVTVIQIVIITILIPLTFYYLLLSLRRVDNIMLSEVRQRRIPLIVHCVLLIVLLKRSIPLAVYPELHFFFLASLVSTCAALILVFIGIKASLHMMGISALTIFVMALSLHAHTRLIALVAILLISNGLVATSRLVMKAHSQQELLLGTGLGMIPQLMLLYFWL